MDSANTHTIKKANDKLKTQNPYLTANQGDMFLDILSLSASIFTETICTLTKHL